MTAALHAEDFARFLEGRPAFGALVDEVARRSPLLGRSASTVFALHGRKLGRRADEILSFVEQEFAGRDFAAIYVERVREIALMQERFFKDPGRHTLGAPDTPVSRDAYNLALLLSILFSNHRFEIMEQLDAYLELIRADSGRIASVGAGTGYELKRMAGRLEGWRIEGYEIDADARATALRLLEHYGAAERVELHTAFPLDRPEPERAGTYNGMVLCEILEHLSDPAAALNVCRTYIKPGGYLFATMAVNLAQEDHIYLYPDAASCRTQLRDCGYSILHEWIAPVMIAPPPPGSDREQLLHSGNYIAVARPGGH